MGYNGGQQLREYFIFGPSYNLLASVIHEVVRLQAEHSLTGAMDQTGTLRSVQQRRCHRIPVVEEVAGIPSRIRRIEPNTAGDRSN